MGGNTASPITGSGASPQASGSAPITLTGGTLVGTINAGQTNVATAQDGPVRGMVNIGRIQVPAPRYEDYSETAKKLGLVPLAGVVDEDAQWQDALNSTPEQSQTDVEIEEILNHYGLKINKDNITDGDQMVKITNGLLTVLTKKDIANSLQKHPDHDQVKFKHYTDKIHMFTTKTAASEFYSGLNGRAVGVCRSWFNGRKELGIAPEVVKRLQLNLQKADRGEPIAFDDKARMYDDISTIVHETLHVAHPIQLGAVGSAPVRKRNTDINEGFTEWLARKLVTPFIVGTGLDGMFGEDLRKTARNGITRYCQAYQPNVEAIDTLARFIERKGKDPVKVLLQVYQTGYRKDYTKLAKLLGVTARKLEIALGNAIKEADPEYIRELFD